MDYIANSDKQIAAMLKIIGVSSVDELFSDIPAAIKLPRPIEDDGLSEFEGLRLIRSIASENSFQTFDNYLGAGAYEHYVPAIIPAITAKSGFVTAYTPYQPEASQGILQAIFEFQSAICALTGLDVANASLYDGACACAEACLMALRLRKNSRKVAVAQSLNPAYRAVVEQYLKGHEIEIIDLPADSSLRLSPEGVATCLDTECAALLIQSPNFYGIFEETEKVAETAKKGNLITILCANPLTFGLYKSAKELKADIAVGDCQPLGLPLQFGGPYCGYMACKKEFVRQMPGRIAGKTIDSKGKECFVLTMQAREQHIRREKATSNICSNQALAALASLIAILWYGKKGLKELSLSNFRRAKYLREKLRAIPGLSIPDKAPIFNEFVVQFSRPIMKVTEGFYRENIIPGLPLEGHLIKNSLLVAVTETKGKKELDRYADACRQIMS